MSAQSCSSKSALALAAAAGLLNATRIASAAPSFWDFNDSPVGPPYANLVPGGGSLLQDGTTDAAGNGLGASGLPGDNATHIQFTGPGPSTRLFDNSPSQIQFDSFAFSFDFNPQFLGQFDNILGKEGNAQSLNWQVHLLGDTSSGDDENGLTRLEFVVRGDNPVGFAAAVSDEVIALGGYDPLGNPQWTHVEGAYDSGTGAISLVLSGAWNSSTFATGDVGLISSNGGTLFLGTGGSGGFSAFAANGYVDNLAIVPEPATLSLLTLSGFGLLARRRRPTVARRTQKPD